MLCALYHCCYIVSIYLCYLLGVECSIRIIKRPDHIMRKPGAGYNCAETWQRRKSTREIDQCLNTPCKREKLLFFSKAPGSSTQSGTVSFFLLSSEPLRPRMSEWLPEVVLPFSLMTCRGLGQQSGMKASLVEGFQKPFLKTVTKQNINCGGYFWILRWHVT